MVATPRRVHGLDHDPIALTLAQAFTGHPERVEALGDHPDRDAVLRAIFGQDPSADASADAERAVDAGRRVQTRTRQTGNTAPTRFADLRGRALANRRNAVSIGQTHLAQELTLDGPLVSVLENERLGGMPQGMSSRYQQALARITDGDLPCFEHCGCTKA